jgi:cobalt/nickel transport protein
LKISRKQIIGITVMVALFVAPFLLNSGAEFSGSDDQGTQLIQQIQSGFKPWMKPIWEPPSTEIQSLLFSVQAALGALIIGYYIGVMRSNTESKVGSKKKEAGLEN